MADTTVAITGEPVQSASSKGDNLRRAGRSLLQFAVALLLSGVVTQVWNGAVDNYHIDPFLSSTISVLIGALVVFVQNQFEDATGKGLFVPKDRTAGGAVLGTGIGAKTAIVVGDTRPDVSTEVVKTEPKPVNPRNKKTGKPV